MELYHYGVKGMHWGVRRTPEQLGHKNKSTLISDAIKHGEVSKQINREKQLRHTRNNHVKGRSYINGDLEYAQQLVDKLGGTGKPVLSRKGEWTHKEQVEDSHVIGTHVDENGATRMTNKAMIVYSKTGSHIYPRKEK